MATTKVPNNLIDLSGDSGALPWAVGTTAQRPGSPNSGDFRFNTDDSVFEFYNGTEWRQIDSFNPYEINYLMLAGGGGGGSTRGDACGGGGAGGALTSYTSNRDADIAPLSILGFSSGTTYTITIGGGGSAAPNNTDQKGLDGDDTVMSGSDITTLTAVGGGGGSTRGQMGSGSGRAGGCGGGAGGGSPQNAGGSGTAGQGFDGGDQQNQGPHGTGGGGTQSAGAASFPSYIPPLGGNGLESSITGTANYYGGGGGGGQGGGTGLGGNGGGGNGGRTNTSGTNGTANTGGGGGGQGRRHGSGAYMVGGNGASCVFILSIPTSIYSGTITGSPTVTTNGGNTILTYTGSGTYTH